MTQNLSVFFPAFNEEGSIRITVNKAIKILEGLKLNYEIIIIDDGSKDQTAKAADSLAKENSKIKVYHHEKNLGYGEALKSGFYNAKYDVIVYTDGDGQFDFSEITKFLEKIESCDLVIGYRIKRQDPFFRILFKKGWSMSLWIMFGLTLKDVDCGFKMIKRDVLEKIPRLESQRGAMINAELAIKGKKFGFKTGEVGVNHYPRLSGKPTGASLKVIISSYLDLLKLWWKLKDSKILFLALVAVILLAVFLRAYKLSEYMTFLGDEGRDVIVIKKILTEGDLPFIGPPTSVGNIYLGPFYYYMMIIPLTIFWLNPAAAAGMNVLIGAATVVLIYYLGKIWFGRGGALIAAYLYAISPVTITYSRSSWNPNPAPFFSLIGIWASFKAYQSKNFLWFILVGAAAAAALQMHYLALILIPAFFLIWLYQLRSNVKKFVLFGSIGAVLAFWLMMLPLVFFDLKHNFLNANAIKQILFASKTVGFNLLASLAKIPDIYFNKMVGRYISGEIWILSIIVGLLIFLPILKLIQDKFSARKPYWPILALSIWLLIGLIGLSFYQGSIFDHYLGFVNPAPYLLIAASISLMRLPKLLGWIGVFVLLFILTLTNFQRNPLQNPSNNQLKRTQEIAKFIIKEVSNKPFNFALLSENNYDDAYRFYLDLYNHKPKDLPFDKTDQLFVVCEDQICDPIYSPKHEIAAFGWVIIERQWNVEGLRVFKLIHNPKQL